MPCPSVHCPPTIVHQVKSCKCNNHTKSECPWTVIFQINISIIMSLGRGPRCQVTKLQATATTQPLPLRWNSVMILSCSCSWHQPQNIMSLFWSRIPWTIKEQGWGHSQGGNGEKIISKRKKLKGTVVENKFSLLWGEAQLCLPYDCL